jgi:hypothetical protein
MISPAQARVLRDAIVAAVGTAPAAVQTIPAARVVWVPREHPAPDVPCAILSVLGAECNDVDGERLYAAAGAPAVLVETVRTIWDVTVSVQLATRMSDAAPSLAHNAWTLARRLVNRLRSDVVADALDAVGTGIQRMSGVRDLSRFTGPQSESRVAVDLVLRIAVLDTVEPGWIATVAGTGTLLVDGASSLAVPFTGADPEP